MPATPPLLETDSGKLQRQSAIEDVSAIENMGNKDCLVLGYDETD